MRAYDKRILNRMQEDERKQYEQDLHKNLPDLIELSEFVDTHLLMVQLPSRKQKAINPEDTQGNAAEEA